MNIRLLFSIITSFAFLMLFGCINQEITDKGEDNLSDENLKTPPSLTISVDGIIINPIRGTYSWDYNNGDGTSTGIHADSAVPPELVENQKFADVTVTPNTQIKLNFEITPKDYQVRIWDSDNNIIGSYKEFILIGQAGKVIYEVLANWEQGTVSYAFPLNVQE